MVQRVCVRNVHAYRNSGNIPHNWSVKNENCANARHWQEWTLANDTEATQPRTDSQVRAPRRKKDSGGKRQELTNAAIQNHHTTALTHLPSFRRKPEPSFLFFEARSFATRDPAMLRLVEIMITLAEIIPHSQ